MLVAVLVLDNENIALMFCEKVVLLNGDLDSEKMALMLFVIPLSLDIVVDISLSLTCDNFSDEFDVGDDDNVKMPLALLDNVVVLDGWLDKANVLLILWVSVLLLVGFKLIVFVPPTVPS